MSNGPSGEYAGGMTHDDTARHEPQTITVGSKVRITSPLDFAGQYGEVVLINDSAWAYPVEVVTNDGRRGIFRYGELQVIPDPKQQFMDGLLGWLEAHHSYADNIMQQIEEAAAEGRLPWEESRVSEDQRRAVDKHCKDYDTRGC